MSNFIENAALHEDRFSLPFVCKNLATLECTEGDIDLGAFKSEIDARIERNASKILNYSRGEIGQAMLDILALNKYRYGSRLYHNSARPLNLEKIAFAQSNGLSIGLTFSFFPAKIPNPLKTFGTSCASVDIGECASLLRLYEIAGLLSRLYEPGVRWIVGMDGVKYHSIFGIPKNDAIKYTTNIRNLAQYLGINNYFEFIEETSIFPHDFKQAAERKTNEIIDRYGTCTETTSLINALSRSAMLSLNLRQYSIPELMNLFDGQHDGKADSEIIELRNKIQARALRAAFEYQGTYRTVYDLNIDKNPPFAEAIKCTVHPKFNQLGIYPVDRSVRIFPYHGQGVLKRDGSRVDDISVAYAVDILRITNGRPLHGVSLDPKKYPFADAGHPFVIKLPENKLSLNPHV